jgi:anti-sigma factor RsiW
MNSEEMLVILPDLVEETLPVELRAEVEAALARCPECQQELEVARQMRSVLMALRTEEAELQVSANFEAQLLARIHQQDTGLEVLALSSGVFGFWLRELLNLVGALIGLEADWSEQSARAAETWT